jgi:hypothetical protein
MYTNLYRKTNVFAKSGQMWTVHSDYIHVRYISSRGIGRFQHSPSEIIPAETGVSVAWKPMAALACHGCNMLQWSENV